ncbi:protein mono-ADP-ribosyltransferase PARP9-like [Oncorhynchus clarkii lewisi]|uniref:protein mono-ADP-ribosyltransferase PARP9-like n=1 Tax=Oncorhynchus clarkii lewisi TaxID=490388 RepID=UPI0039B8EB78
MARSESIPLEEEMLSILDRCGPALTYVLHSKFGCTAVLHGVDAGAMKFKKPVFKHETVHSDSRDARKSVPPFIELCGAYHETLREARRWYLDALYPASKNVITIHNNFIQHFGQREFEELLSLQTKREVSIEENFKDGRFGLTIQGASRGFKAAVLEVEALCCKVQEDFAKEELSLMGLKSPISSPRKPVDDNSSDYKERQQHFAGLQIVRVEKVENKALKQVFDLRKRQLQVSTPSQRMYQRLPVQFCDLLSRVGFQMEFTPPDEQNLGEGIYFSSSVHGAERLWKGSADQEYLYFIEAQVLTGKSIVGCPGLIVPPPFARDPLTFYDSVKGGGDTWVVFNGHQALPEYLITCNKPTYVKPHALFNWGKAKKPQKNEDIVIEGLEVDPAVFHVSSKVDRWIKDLNLKEPESSSIPHDAVYQSESHRHRIHDMRIQEMLMKARDKKSFNRNITAPSNTVDWQQRTVPEIPPHP